MTSDKWYLRFKNGKMLLGLIDADGAAITSGTDVIFSADAPTVELVEDDELIPIPARFMDSLCKGIAVELLSIDNVVRADYIIQFENMRREFTQSNSAALLTGSRKKGILS